MSDCVYPVCSHLCHTCYDGSDEVQVLLRAISSERQLMVPVTIESVETRNRVEVVALLNSGFTKTCIDKTFTRKNQWPLQKMKVPLQIVYANGPAAEENQIHYFVNLKIKVAGTTVTISALVTCLGKHQVFLGYDWLEMVNLMIDWTEKQVTTKEKEISIQTGQEGMPDYKTTY
jgi:predicted aspartyl protease